MLVVFTILVINIYDVRHVTVLTKFVNLWVKRKEWIESRILRYYLKL